LERKKYNKIYEVIIFGAIVLALSLIFSQLVPQSSFALMAVSFAAPLIAVMFAKHDAIYTVIVLMIVFAVVWAISSLPTALIEVISIGATGIGIGYAFKNKFTLKPVMIFGGLGCTIGFILTNIVSINFYKTNLIQDVLINGTIIPTTNLLVNSFKNNEQEIVQLINSILANIPAIITVTSFIAGFVIIIISLIITRKAGYNVTSVEPFSEFKLPAGVIGFSILAQILSVGDGQGSDIDRFTMVFLNLSYILDFFFMVQGIALVDFLLKKIGLLGSLRIIVYTIGGVIIVPFIFIPIFPFLLTVAGILDALMDFRKLESRG
jgi:uncharacterized protein YybS (DUF2232 family)